MKNFIALSVLIVCGFAMFQGCATVQEPKVVVLDKLIVLEDAHFKKDTDMLTRKGERAMIRNINELYENPEVKIRIAGYTSASGDEEFNKKLSERRVNTIKKILIAGNIAPGRITEIKYGDAKPAAYVPIPKNIEVWQKKAKRRVIFEIIVN